MVSDEILASSVGFCKKTPIVALTLTHRNRDHPPFISLGVHRESASEKSHLLRVYKILFLIVSHTQEMRYLEKCPTEPGSEDTETNSTIPWEPAHSSPHIQSKESLTCTTVTAETRSCQGINRTWFCTTQQKKFPVREPAEINLCVKYCMYWGRVTSSAGSLSLVTESSPLQTCCMGPEGFPTWFDKNRCTYNNSDCKANFLLLWLRQGKVVAQNIDQLLSYSLSDIVVFLYICALFLPTDWVWNTFKIFLH